MSLRLNSIWNIIGGVGPLLFAVFAIPYLMHHLGDGRFGILTLIWALIGYFSLFDFGVGRALTYEISKRSHAPLTESAPYIRSGMILTIIAGLIGGFIVWAGADVLSHRWLGIEGELQEDAGKAFCIAALGVIPATITASLRGTLEGLNKFAASNINKFIVGAAMFLLPVIAVYFHGKNLWMITLYMVIGRVFLMITLIYQLRNIIFLHCNVRREIFLKLINYGGWIALTGIIGPLMVYGDRFFVSAAVGTESLSLYTLPQEALQRILIIPAALCGALLPKLAASSYTEMKGLYENNYKKIFFGMLLICLTAALMVYPILSAWISNDFSKKALPVALIMILGIWLNSLAMVPYTVLHAMGKPKITALFHLIEIFLYVILIFILTEKYGIVGAAIAWTLRVAFDLVLLKIAVGKVFNEKEKHSTR